MLRHKATMSARRYLDAHGFVDIETPILYKSTPEGAREFLVPSRLHHGQFYALPQSPQLFKQMLMMAGFDRYYQIVKCFRDEDLRADRQPEFTQIDVETSFLDELEIRELMEGLVRSMFKETLGVDLPHPFPVMTYADAMRDYGSDKPDLRIPLKLTELTDLMKTVDFKVFRSAADLPDGRVAALSRARRRHAVAQGDRRLHDVRRRSTAPRDWPTSRSTTPRKPNEQGLQSPIVKFLRPRRAGRDLRAHRRRQRRPHFLRRRPRESRLRRARRVARQGRPRARLRDSRLAAAVGGRFSDVRIQRRVQDLGGAAPSVHRAEGRPRRHFPDRSRQRDRQGLRRRAQRLGNRRRLGPHPSPGRAGEGIQLRSASASRTSGRNSASCSTRCSTARRRTAASPSASTA